MSEQYPVGAIIENSLRQFAKIISVKNGVYGLSGWSTRENAEKATVAHKHVNAYGLQYANARIVKSGNTKAAKNAPADNGGSKPTTAKPKSDAKAKGGKTKKAPAKAAKPKAKGKK